MKFTTTYLGTKARNLVPRHVTIGILMQWNVWFNVLEHATFESFRRTIEGGASMMLDSDLGYQDSFDKMNLQPSFIHCESTTS